MCDALDDEPEAASMGRLIANKINKFESCQTAEENEKKIKEKEALLMFIEDVSRVK